MATDFLVRPFFNYMQEFVYIIPRFGGKPGKKINGLNRRTKRNLHRARAIGPVSSPWTTAAILHVERTGEIPHTEFHGEFAKEAWAEFEANGMTAERGLHTNDRGVLRTKWKHENEGKWAYPEVMAEDVPEGVETFVMRDPKFSANRKAFKDEDGNIFYIKRKKK